MANTISLLMVAIATLTNGIQKSPIGFQGINCNSDVPSVLVGRTLPGGRVVVIEARYKDIGLKDLGGSEISDNLFFSSWLICGNEYLILEDKKRIIRDVMKAPQHSRGAPMFIGTGQVNGKNTAEAIIAILKVKEGDNLHSITDRWTAINAWRIDEKKAKFISFPTEGLLCSRDGICTVDGGL